MNRSTFRYLLFLGMLLPAVWKLNGQISMYELDGADRPFTYDISALFLTIAPDARAAGMGDAGVASDPDVNAQHWNPAKYAMIRGKGGVSASYTPWLRNLIPNINLGTLTGYYRINDRSVLSSSFRYFSLGKINFAHLMGSYLNRDYLYEFAGDLAYSQKFTENLSAGVAIRYIQSHLVPVQTNETKTGRSVAGDLSIYYQKRFGMGAGEAIWALGGNLSNIGTPVSYHVTDEDEFPIPTNLRIGSMIRFHLNENHSISLLADFNKLLVPTPPVYELDTLTGDLLVVRGKEPPESVLAGMIQSFYDAPGVLKQDGTNSVLREELHEISFSLGAEYWFDGAFAFRTGYHHEHATKGNRKFFTLGFGGRFRFLAADFSYLLPLNGRNSPLANTFRFTLTAEFGRSKSRRDQILPE